MRSGVGRFAAMLPGEYLRRLESRSQRVVRYLQRNIGAIAIAWTAAVTAAIALKLLLAPVPVRSAADALALILPYCAVALAPVAGLYLADRAFPQGTLTAQPSLRLSPCGKWRRISITEARANPLFGPAGFMASMLVGLLLNVAVRSLEFFVSIPALNGHAPAWGQSLFLMMSADLAVMGFFYMVCFILALRSVAYFPRMLIFTWVLDIAIQCLIARQIGMANGLPAGVAEPLQGLLTSNVDKVLISVAVWLPYLILSERVNVTFRQRVYASSGI
ncbi:DUF2569 domain-containing protein [Novosphingobium sp. ZN18A2]|uniref:DUF2569 domain-containing protein n=1 Tax=Novosphingobium sp. ZN18A2 TaxID=3079861 RepID=UPI0030D11207